MFNLKSAHPSWQPILLEALAQMNQEYLRNLQANNHWLPGTSKIFNAFSLPLLQVNYILFGESPYPRSESANGYAFWDANVKDLWSEKGLSKAVNRATSLRNWIKLLLVAENKLQIDNMTQESIAHIDKSNLIKTAEDFFHQLLNHGFLLLNTSLVLHPDRLPAKDAKEWLPFIKSMLAQLAEKKIKLILWGNIAKKIKQLPESTVFETIEAEHPYNLSFIQNKTMQDFFRPFRLL